MTRPRIRSIKPEMFADESFGRLSDKAQILFIGLIAHADDDGRLRALPAALIGDIFPYADMQPRKFVQLLAEVEAARLVVTYEVDGLPYAWLPGWAKHQRVNRPTPSSLPEPPGSDHGKLTEDSVNDHDCLTDRARSYAQARVPIPSDPVVEPSEDEAAGAREVAELDKARERLRAATPRKVRYRGKTVPVDVVVGAEQLLDVFNEATGRALGAWTGDSEPSPACKQIIGAMLARPDVPVDRWEAGVRRTVESPPSFVNGGPVQIGHVFGEKAAEWALTENAGTAADDGDRLIREAMERAS